MFHQAIPPFSYTDRVSAIAYPEATDPTAIAIGVEGEHWVLDLGGISAIFGPNDGVRRKGTD